MKRRWPWLALLLVFMTTEAGAHNLGESYLYLQIYTDRVTGRFEIRLPEFNAELQLTGTEREITAKNLDERLPFLEDYYLKKVRIAAGGMPVAIRFTSHAFLDVRGGFALLSFDLEGLDRVPERLTFDYAVLFDEEPEHRGFLLVEHNWATGTFGNEGQISLVFSPTNRVQEFDITTAGRLRGFLAIVRLGMEHIWMGFDHVMFLVALLLPSVLVRKDGRWRGIADFGPALINVVKIVTAFTVAHSVTLTLAALGIVHLPGRFVEVVIAASIAIAAADILFPLFPGRIWLIVFGFGLFHGFGCAGALEEMGVLREHLTLSLLGFNLGVELGQLAVVLLVWPLLRAFTRVREGRPAQHLVETASAAVAGLGLFWFATRAYG
jgi:hypothetical protein